MQAQIATLRGQVGTLRIQVEPAGTSVLIDGEKIGEAPISGAYSVNPGMRQVRAEAEGHTPTTREIVVSAGQTVDLVLSLGAAVPARREGDRRRRRACPEKHMRRRGRLGPAVLLGVLAAAAGGGCQLFVDTEVAAGLGSPCNVDSDCQASDCRNRVCSVACCDPGGCSEPPPDGGTPPTCGQGIDCALPLRVGVLFRQDPSSESAEDWTKGHVAGIELAMKDRPKITLVTREVEDKPHNVGPTDAAIQELVDDQCDVIIATSPSMGEAMERSAQQPLHASIKYLTCGGKQSSKDHVSYFGQMYKAAYFTGYLAALRSTSHALGIIGAFVTPTVAAYINAFAVGANVAVAGTKIHVNWMKDWHDRADFSPPQTIAQLTSELLNGDSDGLAYQVDDRKPVTVAGKRRSCRRRSSSRIRRTTSPTSDPA